MLPPLKQSEMLSHSSLDVGSGATVDHLVAVFIFPTFQDVADVATAQIVAEVQVARVHIRFVLYKRKKFAQTVTALFPPGAPRQLILS